MNDILLVEDNVELADLIIAFLKKKGFSLSHAQSGESAMEWLKTQKARLLILDIMLPNMDGFALCQSVRQTGSLPIIIISARSSKDDKLMGFELGADDYMEKPIDIDILCAKVGVLLKRTEGIAKKNKILKSGAIQIDEEARKAFLYDKQLDLNVKEFELLQLLLRNEGKTLHKEYLFNQIWGQDCESENQTLTVHIKMLRKKIEEDARNPKRIQTVWGVGYRYEKI